MSVGCDALNLALERRLSEGRTGEDDKQRCEAHHRTIANAASTQNTQLRAAGGRRSSSLPRLAVGRIILGLYI